MEGFGTIVARRGKLTLYAMQKKPTAQIAHLVFANARIDKYRNWRIKNEAHARIKINQLLGEAGWRFFDNEEGKANILLENYVKITQQEIDAWGYDYEKTKKGCKDLTLTDLQRDAG